MSKMSKWMLIAAIALVASAILGIASRAAHRTETAQETGKASRQTTAEPLTGTAAVTLDSQTQSREGIRVEMVKPISMRTQLRGTAVVLSVTDLANARTNYLAAARTNLRRDQTNLAVAQSQYQRVKKLYEQNQNMSLKAMQDAESAYRNSEAQLATDQQKAHLQLVTVRQRWGPTVTGWIESSAPELDAVLEQHKFLVQVNFPPGQLAKPPQVVALSLLGSSYARAKFVSALPEVNPRIQSLSYLYSVPAKSGVAVGMNLAAMIPVGRLLHGSVVPLSAVVWWQGAAWAYEKTSSNGFSRRAVPTDTPVNGGYFVPVNVIPPGTKLVTTGASTLLSNELLVHSQGEQESDDDD